VVGVITMVETTETQLIGTGGLAAQALEAVAGLRTALSELEVSGDVRSRAGWMLDDMVDELCRPDPDRDVMASRLWRLTEFLRGSGVDVGSGTPMFGPIAGIAAWVGPLGEALLTRLG
jgi:hypothetical protein